LFFADFINKLNFSSRVYDYCSFLSQNAILVSEINKVHQDEIDCDVDVQCAQRQSSNIHLIISSNEKSPITRETIIIESVS
jgi:hypothetical protein